MKTLTKLIIALLLGATLLQGMAFEKLAKSRATQVLITSEKPLTTGNNTLHFKVGHENYKDSTMSVKVFMPAMPGMPHMESVTEAKSLGNGEFEINVNLSMGGTWQVHIFLTPKTGKKVRVKTSFNI